MKNLNFKLSGLMVFIVTLLVSSGCKRELDMEPEADYNFTIELAPVQKGIKKGESVDLQLSVVHHGYEGSFKFRYFQSEGSGVLKNNTDALEMNKDYTVPADGKMALHYTSDCEVGQRLDFIFIDPLGNRKDYTVRFYAETGLDRSFNVLLAPVRSSLRSGEPLDLEFTLVCNNPYEGAAYTFRYFQTEGIGKLFTSNSELVNISESYAIASNGKVKLRYVSACHIPQKLVFVFEDQIGNRMEYPVLFSDRMYPYFGIEVPLHNISFPIRIYLPIELKFTISETDPYEVRNFKYKYSQSAGSGAISKNGVNLNPNQWYPVPENGQFILKYNSYGSLLHRLDFIVEDTYGNQEEYILEFEGKP